MLTLVLTPPHTHTHPRVSSDRADLKLRVFQPWPSHLYLDIMHLGSKYLIRRPFCYRGIEIDGIQMLFLAGRAIMGKKLNRLFASLCGSAPPANTISSQLSDK